MSSQQNLYIKPTKLNPNVQEKLDKFRSIGAFTEVQLEELERNGKILRKSAEISNEARKEGNALYNKEGHDSHIHKAILIHYSKSIAFAPENTEELALGYSNRSILLKHIHRYEESLIDIDRALKNTKDDALKTKLEALKEKCLGLIIKENLQNSVKNLSFNKRSQEAFASKLKNFKRSATLPCASDCVRLAYNDTFGRHLVATRDIKPGEILIIEQGYACYPKEDQTYLVCSHCLQIAWNGIPCDDCVFAIYCSETCKNEAFTDYHDIECPAIKYVMACTVPNVIKRMTAMRSLIIAIKREGFDKISKETTQLAEEKSIESLLSNGILNNDKFKACYNLLSYAEHYERDNKDEDMFQSIMVYLLITNTDLLFMGNNRNCNVLIEPTLLLQCKDILTKLKYIIDFNGHLYKTSPFECGCQNLNECERSCNNERGVVIAPYCSLLNHSCTANIARESIPKRKFIIYSLCPIKKGEQLFDSYRVSIMTHDLEDRQSQLKLMFHFTCKCQACKEKICLLKDSVLNEKNQKKILAEFQKCFPKAMNNSFFVDSYENWEFSEEVLQYVVRTSQLCYEHLGYYEAYKHNYRGKIYIEKLIIELYGEKCTILNHC